MVTQQLSQQAQDWLLQDWISGLDLALANLVFSRETHQRELLALTAAIVSQCLSRQHVCIGVGEVYLCLKSRNALPQGVGSQADFITCLHQSRSVSTGDSQALLILQQGCLYLHRYWQYEVELASLILERCRSQREIDESALQLQLAQLFPEQHKDVDWQKIAVCLAAKKKFCVITGGPGTGKTTTVTRLMALVQGISAKKLDIRLVAPTGKAAARLSESIAGARGRLPEAMQTQLPDQCTTIHRLLGVVPNSPYFRHHKDNPLHLDMLILDEASMVDLPMMTKLLQALPPHCQLVMLGDREQLASVEVGNVLGDMCHNIDWDNQYSQPIAKWLSDVSGCQLQSTVLESGSSDQHNPVRDNLVMLRKSHRFQAQSAVGKMARMTNQGQLSSLLSLLRNADSQGLEWYEEPQFNRLFTVLLPGVKAYFKAVNDGDLFKAFSLLASQQVLCAGRKGTWGVENLNLVISRELNRLGLINGRDNLYVGKPVMITENEHNLNLYNGDIGILAPDPSQPELLKVWFINSDAELVSFLPGRLPANELVYAMTIHKSQGSEFERVVICLDPKHGKMLNRELIYTAITRAKKQVSLFASPGVLSAGIRHRSKRGSGLSQRLTNLNQRNSSAD